MHNIKTDVLVLALLIVITTFFTYPLVFHLKDEVPGDYDTYWFLWDLWHFEKALDSNASPFYTNMLFYPHGTSLYASTTTPLLALASIPLQRTVGLYASYNILYLLSYVLSGFFMYLLAKHITDNRPASFLAALIFAFSPYHSAHAERHLNLMSAQWIPLLFLSYLMLKKERDWKHSLVFGLALALTGLSEMTYLAISLIFIGLDLALDYKKTKKLPSGEFALYLVLGVLLFCLISSPYLLGIAKEMLFTKFQEGGFGDTLGTAVGNAPDIVMFFIPSAMNPIFHSITEPIYTVLTKNDPAEGNEWINERSVFLGYTSICLIVVALKSKKLGIGNWWHMFVGAFVMTLGPFLKVFGLIVPLLMPYFFFILLPFSHLLRVSSRFDIIVVLTAAILAAIAAKHTSGELSKKGRAAVAVFYLALYVFVIIEFYAPIEKYLDLSASEFYYEIKNEAPNYSIIEIPYTNYWFSRDCAKMVYLQSVHGKPLVNICLSRASISIVRELESTECIKYLFNLEVDKCKNKGELDTYKVKYVVLHKDNVGLDELNKTKKELEKIFDREVFEDKKIVVFRVYGKG